MATSDEDSWWENSESARREEELRREEEVIAEHERWESEEADTAAVEVVAEPADVLGQLDDLINDATEQGFLNLSFIGYFRIHFTFNILIVCEASSMNRVNIR